MKLVEGITTNSMPVEGSEEMKVLVKLGDDSEILSIEFKIENQSVLNHTSRVYTLGQGHCAALNGPSQTNLSS